MNFSFSYFLIVYNSKHIGDSADKLDGKLNLYEMWPICFHNTNIQKK